MSKQEFNTTLPQNAQEFQAAIRSAIEYATKSPYNNQNKLNDATAASLGFPNFNALKPHLDKLMPIAASYTDGKFYINEQEINDDVYHEQMTDFYIVPREDEIYWITQYISDGVTLTGKNKELAIKDMTLLAAMPDEYLLKSHETNKYLSPTQDTEEFNAECNKMLVASGLKPVKTKITQPKLNNKQLAELMVHADHCLISVGDYLYPFEAAKIEEFISLSWDDIEKESHNYLFSFNIDTFERKGRGKFTLKSERYGELDIILMSNMNI